VFIAEIEACKWAHWAGLKVGDELLSVHGRPLVSMPEQDLSFLMRRIRPLKMLFGRSGDCGA
jgi:hypothetical protein